MAHRDIAARTGFRSVQSTPLQERRGAVIGMLSTHYRAPHRPSERDGRLLDLLARHAADLVERLRAEEALRLSETRFRTLASHAPVGIFQADALGNCEFANERWSEMTGLSQQEACGPGWTMALHPEDRERVQREWYEAAAAAREFVGEYRFRTPGGKVTWVSGSAVALRSDTGAIAGYLGTVVDITARKETEEALRASERRFRQLADAMPQIVWTAGRDGQIDYLNRRWTEFSGQPGAVGNDAWGPLLHPEERGAAGERWAASVATGAPFEMELRLLDRHRTYRWHLLRTVAVKDEAGLVTRWYGTATDIQEQKRAEEASRYLAEASAALAAVVDHESTLQKVARLAVPFFADWSAVDVLEDGRLKRLAVAHQDPEKIRLAHELMRDYPPDPDAPGGVFEVLRTRKHEVAAEITDDLLVRGARDERHLSLIRSLGLRSYICVPLVVSGDAFGALTFATAESGRRYTDADVALATDLAHRAAVAIENTQLYQALRDQDRRKDEFLATLGPRAAEPVGADPKRAADPEDAPGGCGDGRAVPGGDGAAGAPPGADGR